MGSNLKLKAPVHHDLEKEAENGSDGEFRCYFCFEVSAKRLINGSRCSHPVCTDCTITQIRCSLENCTSGQILCPDLYCTQELDPLASWVSTIDPTLFVRWCHFLAEAAVMKSTSSSDRCYCPNLSCNELILNECGGNPKQSKCPNCNSLFCFKCKKNWHEGYRCNRGVDCNDDVATVRRLVKKNKWKRCPACEYVVERKSGCSQIMCRCGIKFCYHCGNQFSHDGACVSWTCRIRLLRTRLRTRFCLGSPLLQKLVRN